jgi:putative phosphoribosyl transferase
MFEDRDDAGRRLGEALRDKEWTAHLPKAIVLGIPRGGVPVAYHVARALATGLDLVVPRKIQIPWNPEAGLGAVTADGTVTLNEDLVPRLGLTNEQIHELADRTIAEVRRREAAFRGSSAPPQVNGRTVVVVDDGLASGFTMIAALRGLRAQDAGRLIVGAPCAPVSTLRRVKPHADEVVCVEVDHGWSFAVASHYARWWDLSDDEVHEYLDRARAEGIFGQEG